MKIIHYLCLLAMITAAACNNYGLLEKLQNPGDSEASFVSCGSNCRIFITASQYSANLGGPSGADAICRADSANPGSKAVGAWKALVAASPLRVACTSSNCATAGLAENVDWVLRPNASYRRPDGTLITTTNASALFNFPLTNLIGAAGGFPWTGLTAAWQQGSGCTSWLDNTTGLGRQGDSGSFSNTSIFSTNGNCTAPASSSLYCVEQ